MSITGNRGKNFKSVCTLIIVKLLAKSIELTL